MAYNCHDLLEYHHNKEKYQNLHLQPIEALFKSIIFFGIEDCIEVIENSTNLICIYCGAYPTISNLKSIRVKNIDGVVTEVTLINELSPLMYVPNIGYDRIMRALNNRIIPVTIEDICSLRLILATDNGLIENDKVNINLNSCVVPNSMFTYIDFIFSNKIKLNDINVSFRYEAYYLINRARELEYHIGEDGDQRMKILTDLVSADTIYDDFPGVIEIANKIEHIYYSADEESKRNQITNIINSNEDYLSSLLQYMVPEIVRYIIDLYGGEFNREIYIISPIFGRMYNIKYISLSRIDMNAYGFETSNIKKEIIINATHEHNYHDMCILFFEFQEYLSEKFISYICRISDVCHLINNRPRSIKRA